MERKKDETSKVVVEAEFNGQKLVMETGVLAKSATIAIKATLGGTTVLVTVVSAPGAPDKDFFPLRVDYEERFYAGGLIGGSRFTRREGRPTDQASVSARLMDHAIRPLFPKDFMDETQIITTVMSVDGKNCPVLLGFLAASTALLASGLPFKGPLVPLRIQKINGEYSYGLFSHDHSSDVDFVVTYLDEGKKVQAMEAESNIIPEEEIVSAIKKGAEVTKVLFDLQKEFSKKVGNSVREYVRSWLNKDAIVEVSELSLSTIENMYEKGFVFEGAEWRQGLLELEKELAEKFDGKYSAMQITTLVSEVQKNHIRKLVLNGKRIDGRKNDEIRQLESEVGVISRVHGSALFSRGLTQSLTITTLASGAQKQLIQNMDSEEEKRYMHHYNFPPYSTGEVRGLKGPDEGKLDTECWLKRL